ncbi:MAG: FHA domain-containing protein [Bdellovibrionales bacterium]|nr:FHA domain-containing protein [Bdellovibrionales bacterium]
MAKLLIFVNSKELDSITLDEAKEYIIGRAKDADINIRDTTFSRKHLRLYYENNWKVECLSKFADIQAATGSTKFLELVETTDFMIAQYRFSFQLEVSDSKEQALEFNVEEDYLEESELENQTPIEDEDTDVNFQVTQPYLTITFSDQTVNKLKLEGTEWTIGRTDEALVQINDSKASRKHCQISKDGNSFYVMDLGSSNGTYLNRRRMKANKIAPLNSGDIIRIGSTQLVFEMIDESFQSKLLSVPTDALKPQLPAVSAQPQNPYAALQVRSQGGLQTQGAVRIFSPAAGAKKDKKKFIAIFCVTIATLAYLLKGEKTTNTSGVKNLASNVETRSPFELLSKDNQDLVVRFYDQAYKLYIQGNYELALNETRKIHRLLPETGYLDLAVEKDSKDLERLITAAVELNRQKQAIQRSQEQQRQLVEEVNAIVSRCNTMARPGTNIQSARACLAPALELDPENQGAARIIARLEAEEETRRSLAAQRAYTAGQVDKGENLYQQAVNLEKNDRLLDAISAYNRHIASTLPDPNNLKEKSKERKQQISLELKKRIDVLMKEATTDYESKNYKDSIAKLTKALRLDPSVQEAKDLLGSVTNDLNKNMKTIYSDSVLEESLGNIESAKSLWKKIIDTDVASGDYYRKAKSKLKKYGG